MAETQERRISGLTLVIDRDLCIGSGNCVKLAPEVFELDATGIVTFRANIPDIERDRLVESCRVCPVDALAATDTGG
jgi:ferredoxin